MPLDRQLFPRDIASSVAKFLEQKKLTAKQAAARYDIDQTTAENIRKGVCGLGTLLKVALVEGRDLWERLGDEIYGETLDAYEERRLRKIMEEAADAQERLVRLRARREAMDARADDALSTLDRPMAGDGGIRRG